MNIIRIRYELGKKIVEYVYGKKFRALATTIVLRETWHAPKVIENPIAINSVRPAKAYRLENI